MAVAASGARRVGVLPAFAAGMGDNGPVSPLQSEPTLTVPSRRIGLLLFVAAVVLALDVVTKMVAVANLEGREPVRVLGGLVYLQVIRNSGAAFSIGTGLTWLFSLIMIGVVLVIAWIARWLRSTGWAIGLGLVLAGALGNLIDRLFRAPGPFRGHVVDFVSVFSPNGHIWPIFNTADAAINIGGAMVVIMALLGRYYDGRSIRNQPKAANENARAGSGSGVQQTGAERIRQAVRAASARSQASRAPGNQGDATTAGADPAEQNQADAEATTRIRAGTAGPTEVLTPVAPEQEPGEPANADEPTKRLPVPSRAHEQATPETASTEGEESAVADEPTTELNVDDVSASSSASRDGL